MRKKYLALISFSYLSMFVFFIFTNRLKNFLAPQMYIYVQLGIIPLFLIFINYIIRKEEKHCCTHEKCDHKENEKFSYFNLILLVPILMIILSGDGKLSLDLASNKNIANTRNASQQKKENINDKEKGDVNKDKKETPKKELFEIDDKNYYTLSNYLTYEEEALKLEGKKIKVKGFTLKKATFLKDKQFAIGKYVITCCASDALFSGFFVKEENLNKEIKENTWYEIEGVLVKDVDKENLPILAIKPTKITEIDGKKEEQYIYPNYSETPEKYLK